MVVVTTESKKPVCDSLLLLDGNDRLLDTTQLRWSNGRNNKADNKQTN
jgi:hypothetical protein